MAAANGFPASGNGCWPLLLGQLLSTILSAASPLWAEPQWCWAPPASALPALEPALQRCHSGFACSSCCSFLLAQCIAQVLSALFEALLVELLLKAVWAPLSEGQGHTSTPLWNFSMLLPLKAAPQPPPSCGLPPLKRINPFSVLYSCSIIALRLMILALQCVLFLSSLLLHNVPLL